MEKPTLITKSALDYSKCTKWIEQKYNVHLRDYARKFHDGQSNSEAPYQDFWHWVIDSNPTVNNGSLIEICIIPDKSEKDFIKEILTMFTVEFGEYANDEGFVPFWIEW